MVAEWVVMRCPSCKSEDVDCLPVLRATTKRAFRPHTHICHACGYKTEAAT